MTLKLCDKCAPLVGRPELDTPAKLAVKLCLPCKARVGAALVGNATPKRAKVSRFIVTALECGAVVTSIVATANTAAALAESTMNQLAEVMGLEEPKRRRRRRRRKAKPTPPAGAT